MIDVHDDHANRLGGKAKVDDGKAAAEDVNRPLESAGRQFFTNNEKLISQHTAVRRIYGENKCCCQRRSPVVEHVCSSLTAKMLAPGTTVGMLLISYTEYL